MLEIKGLDKYFNRFKKNRIHVINEFNLTFEDSGLIALLGPSGCGKTTFLNVIGGLDTSRKGNIYLNGKKINSRFMFKVDKMRNLKIGYIFQDYKLIDNMSVYDNVAIVLTMIGIKDKKEVKKRVEYILDKVGMLRYKKRPAGMLSGGERQRVGIARALVKDPDIILADEPTGNLDSKNSLEIMKIIKAISKEKLVILVTHEASLAKFYASRIIEIKDGCVINDYINDCANDLDYALDNRFYLKDFKNIEKLTENIAVYSDNDNNIKLDIVVKGNNIYVKTAENYKVEVVDHNSSIEMVNEHYKKIAKNDIDLYKFDFKDIINNDYKKRYCSIINSFKMMKLGFQKVFNFSILKKILLIGFFISAMFIMYSFSTLFSCFSIKDENFVTKNRNYLLINNKKVSVNNYLKYESMVDDGYLIPGDSIVTLNIIADDYYQTSQFPIEIKGSLSAIEMLDENRIIEGKMASNSNEIIIDKMIVDQVLNGDNPGKMRGIYSAKDLLGRKIKIDNLGEFILVGVVSEKSPSIYVYKENMINILANTTSDYENTGSYEKFVDYKLFNGKIELKKGRMPVNDYEVIVNIEQKDQFEINKKVDIKVNGQQLLVVGYYYSNEGTHDYLVNSNMIKYQLINNSNDISVYCKNKDVCLEKYRESNLNIVDSYEESKSEYIGENLERLRNTVFISMIIMIISFIEIILMIRASFLSRIKEVGIYRAIGVKRLDIYKMFFGEIFAITTLASVPGILLMAYILSKLASIPMVDNFIYIKSWVVILSVSLVYVFNLVIGLLPVYSVMRKRPAVILARYDLE